MHTLILDVSNLAYRAYFAQQDSPDYAPHRFRAMLRTLEKAVGADTRYAALDSQDLVRKRWYAPYKAGRAEKPAGLLALMKQLPSLLEDAGYIVVLSEGWEADDVIATLVEDALPDVLYGDSRVSLVSTDQDLYGLVTGDGYGPGVYVVKSDEGPYGLVTQEGVLEKLGVPAERVSFYKAIAGDSSDNLPGVPGLGSVCAKRLVREYANPKQLYEALDKLPSRERKALQDCGFEHLELMHRLTRMNFGVRLGYL